MKILVTGASGQLGYDLFKELKNRGYKDILAPSSKEMDITDKDMVSKVLNEYKPEVIFHCAAYTSVDKAEEEKGLCYDVNVIGPLNIVESAREINAKVIYISTDYVFGDDSDTFHEVNDKCEPINFYGKTKYLSEETVLELDNSLVVRISWVFGINGGNFIKTMLRLGKERKEISVVFDQIGSPTYTVDISRLLVDMMERDAKGVYHATNEGVCSWAELARYVFQKRNMNVVVNEVLTKDYKTTAKRTLNSRLSKSKLDKDGFKRLPDWHDAVDRYLIELEESEAK